MSVVLSSPTAIILDEEPLSLLTMRRGHPKAVTCKAWYAALEGAGHRFYVPEIADYELRRELIRSGKTASLARLDAFNAAEPDRYLALTTVEVQEAARLWAQARNQNRGGAPPEALDGDCLIAAQARLIVPDNPFMEVIVATSNLILPRFIVQAVKQLAASVLGDRVDPFLIGNAAPRTAECSRIARD